MSAPFYVLKHEHRVIERALRALEGICFHLRAGQEVPLTDILFLLDFISGFANGYHHFKEEKYLFPALQRQGIIWEGGVLEAIEQEHKIERDLVPRLLTATKGLEEHEAAAIARFTAVASTYISHMLGHMRHEDATLFRLAEEMIPSAEQHKIYDEFKHAEHEVGLDTIRLYEDLASRLEEKWAI
ncbi:MAG: hemerythrin domain-containing protein [Acidobacteria bacterium]|nr:hemerythrin domain-containing protein [Acidobacteriota bacterium]